MEIDSLVEVYTDGAWAASRSASGNNPINSLVEVYTDGACRGNPGPGGWGALLIYKEHEKMLYGAEIMTTNNRMELTAAIKALAALQRRCSVKITTDSKYVHDGITIWLKNWRKTNWRNSQKKEIKNKDLWLQLNELVQKHEITWHWVKGHSGHKFNEQADKLANRAIDELLAKSR